MRLLPHIKPGVYHPGAVLSVSSPACDAGTWLAYLGNPFSNTAAWRIRRGARRPRTREPRYFSTRLTARLELARPRKRQLGDPGLRTRSQTTVQKHPRQFLFCLPSAVGGSTRKVPSGSVAGDSQPRTASSRCCPTRFNASLPTKICRSPASYLMVTYHKTRCTTMAWTP